MRDSEDGKSLVGILKDKRVQLILGLLVLVVWNFWVLFDKGYVAEAVRMVLVFIVPIVVSFIVIIDYLASLFEFVSIIIGLSFGGVAVRVVSKNIHNAEGKVRVWFVMPVFLLFGLFLLPVWSLYGSFCMWSGVASYVAVWLIGGIVFFLKNGVEYGITFKKVCLCNYSMFFIIFIIPIFLAFIVFGLNLPFISFSYIVFFQFASFGGILFCIFYYSEGYKCDGCGCESEKFSSKEKALKHISKTGWKRNSSVNVSTISWHYYCPSCVVKRQARRNKLKNRGVN